MKRTRLTIDHLLSLVDRPNECPYCGDKVRMRIPNTRRRTGKLKAYCWCVRCKRQWTEDYELSAAKGVRGKNRR